MEKFRKIILIGLTALVFNAVAAPFAEWFDVHTSSGTTVRVWGEGDEYSAAFESEAGYTILYDSSRKAYFYAVQEADGSLVISELELGAPGAAEAIAVRTTPHLRDLSEKAREAREERIRRDETETDRAERWATLKKNTRAVREAKEKGLLMAPPTRPTIGTVKGLTVLIDFPIEGSSKTTWSSVHSNVTVEQLDELLNGENCTLYGNASSVHSYFKDASNGRLDYSMEVIGPIVAPYPRSHYDDSNRDNGECALELIDDVFNVIWNDPDFSTKYLPILQSLTTLNGKVRSLNFWFAGESASTWSMGLWAHKWTVRGYGSTIATTYAFQDANGSTVQFDTYQITPILSSPGIYTFCHENGHMLCGFPDLYCYKGTGNLGVGYFSLMYGSTDKANPPYFDAYLRAAAGWVEPQLLPSTGGVVTVRANHADVWKYANPSKPEEYYLIENRQQTGRDASIRASGILIWRCNEAGDNQYTNALSGFSSSVHRLANELSIEQADGDYDIELNRNYGDKWDTWYAGNGYSKGVFNDSSVPTAQWSDTSASGLSLSNFSSNGETMTFTVAAYTPAAETISLATAVDNEDLEFITEGGARWTGQTAKSYYGGSAAKSGKIGDGRGTWFKTTVEGPGELSFAWMVSSEANYDFLDFSIDGEQKDRISGKTGTWSTKTYEVDAGEHVFVWSYVKDSSNTAGDDAGYVDKIVWTPTKVVEKVAPGVWTNDVELVRNSAALDGKMICVARLKSSLAYWKTVGPLLTGERFLDWAASNGVYLVFWDGDADTDGTSAAAQWFKTLNEQRGKSSSYNWEMCFARPDALETLAGYARTYASGSTHYYVGSVRYEETDVSIIAGFASILNDNGITPTPIFAEADIAPYLSTSGLAWSNRSALSWRDEAVGETHTLRTGGFTNTAYMSTLSATANGPGRLAFAYRAVSASESNVFRFNVNGTERFVRSNGTFAATETITVTASGNATFDWIWSVSSAKDEKYSNGVWISDVSWTPLSPRVAVGGTTYTTLAAAIVHANSRTPLVFESTPTIDAAARTITSALGETVTVADIYDLKIDGNTVSLTLIDSIRKPSVQPYTRVTRHAGQTTEVLVPAFTDDADGAGRPALSVLTRPDFYYALGFVADDGTVTEISDWIVGDGTPHQLTAREPSASSYGRDRYTVLVSEVAP